MGHEPRKAVTMKKANNSPAGNPSEDIRALRRLIADTKGRIFHVLFVSRGRNEPRKMLARLKRTTPEQVAGDLWNLQLTCWDMQKHAWRVVPLERIVHLKCGKIDWLTRLGLAQQGLAGQGAAGHGEAGGGKSPAILTSVGGAK